ncbi:DUF1775 domain-containing protein [Streptomyces sp. NPDC093109]|uniref:DUF1775 domain-containing protein n=1 Tax=Streptomyces sp. NPDC093109 TaxID=3154977 RepID=UPI00344F9C69
MSRTTRPRTRTAQRLSAVTVLAVAASLALAAPASAHVEVEAEGGPAAALAENVTLNFNAESESGTVGITELEVVLPDGIAPSDVSYKEGPKGWKYTATERGYTVAGPAVTPGEDAVYAVTVRRLPDAESLPFKTLQTYSDGRVDRWIELEKPATGENGNSAPVLALEPAAPGAKPVSPSPTAEPTTPPPSTPATSRPADTPSPTETGTTTTAGKGDDSANTALIITAAVAAAALIGGGLWWFRRRGDANAT